jgi:predicted nucleic acid-binding protein
LIVLDTSVLIEGLTSPRDLLPLLGKVLNTGERLIVPTVVLYEWWRGPRLDQELAMQETLFPSGLATAFGVKEAMISARIYTQVRKARGRELDLAIAACAIAREAELWTLNQKDFADVPGLSLFKP